MEKHILFFFLVKLSQMTYLFTTLQHAAQYILKFFLNVICWKKSEWPSKQAPIQGDNCGGKCSKFRHTASKSKKTKNQTQKNKQTKPQETKTSAQVEVFVCTSLTSVKPSYSPLSSPLPHSGEALSKNVCVNPIQASCTKSVLMTGMILWQNLKNSRQQFN